MKLALPGGTTSVICHIFVPDSASTTGAGKTGIAYGSFTVWYVRAGGTLAQLTPQDIATLGTYAAPTANTNIRIKEVSAANAPGLYEVQFHNDHLAAGANQATFMVTASGAAPTLVEIQLANAASVPSASTNASAVRTELATELGRIDAAITTRHAAGAAVAKSPATLDWSADVSNKPTIGTSTLDAAGVRTAVGLATDNLDTQLAAIAGYVDCLPATWVVPAAVGAKMDLADSVNATGVADLKTKLGTIPASGDWRTAITIDGKTEQQALQYIAAAVAGKRDGNDLYGLDGATKRVTVGTNRATATYDPA